MKLTQNLWQFSHFMLLLTLVHIAPVVCYSFIHSGNLLL